MVEYVSSVICRQDSQLKIPSMLSALTYSFSLRMADIQAATLSSVFPFLLATHFILFFVFALCPIERP